MELVELRTRIIPEVQATPGATLYEGRLNFNLAAGEKLQIKNGESKFKETVPAGKKWAVAINLGITETDA